MHPMLLAAIAIGALMLITWLTSLRRRDASIVDLVWGPAFAVVALVSAVAGNERSELRWLLLALTTVWGARLGWHLTSRKRRWPLEDRRYAALRERHAYRFASWSLVWVFGAQGLLVLVISLPLQVAATRPCELTALAIPGVLVFSVGLAFEAIGDAQLAAFRADPANAGAIMDHGLWRYTRHPNYFGDCCVWWGLWLVALTAGGTWWTVVGPLVMTFLLVRGSGKALLERDIVQRRPGYEDYVRRTSGFLPLPPR